MPKDLNRDHPLPDILDRLGDLASAQDVVLSKVVERFGIASFLPLLIVPALLVVSPLSGIPGFSSVCGIGIALIAAQMLFGRDHLWLPGFLLRRKVSGEKLANALPKVRGMANWIDRHTRRRLSVLTSRGLVWVPRLLITLAGLTMVLLEIVPFSSSILGTAVICYAVGLLSRDGAFIAAGAVIHAGASSIPFFVATRLFGG